MQNTESENAKSDKPRKITFSHLIAVGILLTDFISTMYTLYLCRLAIINAFVGALPYLTTLIGALQACTAVVLASYFNKSKAENTKDGANYLKIEQGIAPDLERDC